MRQKVVIIGHSYSSRLSIIRSVAQMGCEITVIVMTSLKSDGKSPKRKPIDCCSRYVNHVYYCLRKDKNALIRILLEYCKDSQQKVILIPDSDDVVVAIDNNQERLKEHFCYPHINHRSENIQYWMDKTHQKELAKRVGLYVADGQVIDIVNGCYDIPHSLEYPCFCKPLATMNGGKGGMLKCDNSQELEVALNIIVEQKSRTLKVLVEEYKVITAEYALLGFSDGKMVTIPGILKFLVESKKNKGIALLGKVMPVNGFEELLEKFRRLVIEIGFVGVFDIDFYQSGEVIYFCEINFRYGGSGYAVTKMGCNLPAMMVKFFSGENIKEEMQMKVGGESIFVNERMCLDDLKNGHITLKGYQKYLKQADIHFISDNNDPNPLREYNRCFLKTLCRTIVKSFLGRRG